MATAADWGRAVMFSPAASLGGFQLCSRMPDSEWCSPVDVASLKVPSDFSMSGWVWADGNLGDGKAGKMEREEGGRLTDRVKAGCA